MKKGLVFCIVIIFMISLFPVASMAAGDTTDENNTYNTSSNGSDSVTNSEADAVVVGSIEAFIQALKPNAEIKLQPGDYYVDDAEGMSTAYANVEWGELDLENLHDVTIYGGKDVNIYTREGNSTVIYADNCSNMTFNSLILGHVTTGACESGVMAFTKCSNIEVNDCTLFGCGLEGCFIDDCTGIYINQSVITSCESDAFNIQDSSNIVFDETEFSHTGNEGWRSLFYVYNCEGVLLTECNIHDNGTPGNTVPMFYSYDGSSLEYKHCRFSNNYYDFEYTDKVVSGHLQRTYMNPDGNIQKVVAYFGTSTASGVWKVSYYQYGIRTSYKIYNKSGKLINLIELYSSGKTKKVHYYSTSTGKRTAYKLYDMAGRMTNYVYTYSDGVKPKKTNYYNVNTGIRTAYKLYDTAGRMTHYAQCYSDGIKAKKMNYYNATTGVRTGYKTYREDGSCSCWVKCDSKGNPTVATYYDKNGKVTKTVRY